MVACFFLFSHLLPQESFAQDRVAPSDRVSTRLNVRAPADVNSKIVDHLQPGQSAELLESVPNWYRIRLQNALEGYVSKAWSRIVSAPTEAAEFIRLGSWNIKKLGHGSATDFPVVASVINDNYDIVAVVEVMQKQRSHPGYDSLLNALGSGWSDMVTDTPRPSTSDSNSEFYAILYRIPVIRPCSGWKSLMYHKENDGGPNGAGPDFFSREPAFGCFEAPTKNNQVGLDFLLAGYHARWEGGDTNATIAEVGHLKEIFQSMAQARSGEKDLIIAGDFNLVPNQLKTIFLAGDRTSGSGSTLNSSGGRTANLYDHLLVYDTDATAEMIGNAEVLDVRSKASSNASFYKTISDHLPIVVRMRSSGPDDD
jgi:endonuclease/exonuclease/phosphatase family metal-dependent hydrolase